MGTPYDHKLSNFTDMGAAHARVRKQIVNNMGGLLIVVALICLLVNSPLQNRQVPPPPKKKVTHCMNPQLEISLSLYSVTECYIQDLAFFVFR